MTINQNIYQLKRQIEQLTAKMELLYEKRKYKHSSSDLESLVTINVDDSLLLIYLNERRLLNEVIIKLEKSSDYKPYNPKKS